MKRNSNRATAVAFVVALGVVGSAPVETSHESSQSATVNQVLEWNQIFIDTLIATNTRELLESAARGDRSHGDL